MYTSKHIKNETMTDKEKIEHLTNIIVSVRKQIKEDSKDLKLVDNKHYGWEEYDVNYRLNNLYKLTKPLQK